MRKLMVEFPSKPPVENLQLLARQVVAGFIIGLHKSPFHGFSVEFSEHKLYNSGDNLRYVDWKLYGRTDKMFTKRFEEETNLRCCLALDTSSSMDYPEGGGFTKLSYACVAAASLGWLVKKQMDALSLALFDKNLYYLSPAKTGNKQQQFIIQELQKLLSRPKASIGTDLSGSLHQLAERLHRRSLVVVFSDIPETPENAQDLIDALQHLKFNKHEVLLFHIVDGDKEIDFHFENRPYRLEDPETGARFDLNPTSYQKDYATLINRYLHFLQEETLKLEIDLVFCDMTQSPEEVLRRYLVKRAKMI